MYKLNFGKGIDKLTFDMTESQILSALGNPENKETVDGTTYFYYDELMVSINEDDQHEDYISFFLEAIDLGTSKIIGEISTEQEARTKIKAFHTSHNLAFEEDIEDVDGEKMYSYENAGLTIWIEEDVVTDICVQEPGVD